MNKEKKQKIIIKKEGKKENKIITRKTRKRKDGKIEKGYNLRHTKVEKKKKKGNK